MTIDRALEIIAAYGADARRWPDDERGGVAALAGDARVAAALVAARELDGLLGDWAQADAGDFTFDAAAISRVVKPRPSVRRWFAGGVLAAGVAAAVAVGAVMLTPMQGGAVKVVPAHSPVVTAAAATAAAAAGGSETEYFADVFTPTVDEDELI